MKTIHKIVYNKKIILLDLIIINIYKNNDIKIITIIIN